MTRGITYIIY